MRKEERRAGCHIVMYRRLKSCYTLFSYKSKSPTAAGIQVQLHKTSLVSKFKIQCCKYFEVSVLCISGNSDDKQMVLQDTHSSAGYFKA